MTHTTKNLFGLTLSKIKSLHFHQENPTLKQLYDSYQDYQKQKKKFHPKNIESDNVHLKNPLIKDLKINFGHNTTEKADADDGTRNRRRGISLKSEPAFSIQMPEYRYRQIHQNLYKNTRNVQNPLVPLHTLKKDIAQWTNLPAQLREILQSEYFVDWGKVLKTDTSQKDLTTKFLTQFEDFEKVESVIIPASSVMPEEMEQHNESTLLENSQDDDDNQIFDSDYAPPPESLRGGKMNQATLCVSSQVGCSMQCSFCFTGTQKMKRNLTTGEIVGQYMNAQLVAAQRNLSIARFVFMGMGEPLYNYRAVKEAIQILTEDFGVSGKKIIVSTCGVVPAMKKLTRELNVHLAVSLHATNNELRDKIVPVNRMFPIEELMDACRDFDKNNGRKLSFEYVMLEDVNDSYEDVVALAKLLHGLNCSVNLIPFNPWPGSPYKSSPKNRIVKFSQYLYFHKIPAPIRWSRGDDTMAACGQLKSDGETKTNFLETHPLYNGAKKRESV